MNYQVTGNDIISLPTLRESDGAAEGLTFLHMGAKGMIELKGRKNAPLLRPMINGKPLHGMAWVRQSDWIPAFSCDIEGFRVAGTILTPLHERAFFYRLEATNTAAHASNCNLAMRGSIGEVWHEINESKPLKGTLGTIDSGWNGRFVVQYDLGLPLFAFAPMAAEDVKHIVQTGGDAVEFTLSRDCLVSPGDTVTADFVFGVGFDEVASSTSAKELMRQGFEAMERATRVWLQSRLKNVGDETLNHILNTNMFFSLFYSAGRSMDTEEFCLMTSRSPRYYVSAAYWDRDSLLWSFPAILMADAETAREVLLYVFTKQIRNVGIHSRFIDGVVLEPGFELDELCAPVIALKRYLDATGDQSFLMKECVREGVSLILRRLQAHRHPEICLFDTFLQPTDDLRVYPYLTYDNVLVWRMLSDIADMWNRDDCRAQARQVKEAIYRHCTGVHEGREMFIWSTDLNGHFDVYDEPPGSLTLLPFYGFCGFDDPLYQAAAAAIRSPRYAYSFADSPIAEIGCPHAPHPWVLSLCNRLLCGETESAIRHLHRMPMDNGVACESVDENTGECATGAAFATCAGFLSYSLFRAMGGSLSCR